MCIRDSLHHVHEGARVVRAQVAHVAQLAEVQLDGHEPAVEVQVGYARAADELLQLRGQPVAERLRAEVCEVHLCRFHASSFSRLCQKLRLVALPG